MKIENTRLPGVLLIEPKVFVDQRGFFQEIWNQHRYAKAGMPETFVQDNLSRSRHGVLRGLHVQNPNAQGKLVYVLEGSVFDVAVDIRRGSPHFGQWVGIELSADNHRQLYIPPGFAHGFCVTSDSALFAYKCTDTYNPSAEFSVLWNDSDIGIDWPIDNPELSAKDQAALPLSQIDPMWLPAYLAT